MAMTGTLGYTDVSRSMPFQDVRNQIPTWGKERNEQNIENSVCFMEEEATPTFMHPMIVMKDGRYQRVLATLGGLREIVYGTLVV